MSDQDLALAEALVAALGLSLAWIFWYRYRQPREVRTMSCPTAEAVLDMALLEKQGWSKSEPMLGLRTDGGGWAWQFVRGPVRIVTTVTGLPDGRVLFILSISHAEGRRLTDPARYLAYVNPAYRSQLEDYADKVTTTGGPTAKWIAIMPGARPESS